MTAKRRASTKAPARRGRKKKVLVNESDIVDVDVPCQELAVASKPPAKKRGRKKKEDTVTLTPINDILNIEDTNEVQEQVMINIPANQIQKKKHISTSIQELLETSDDNLSSDESQVSDNDGVNFRRSPLASITNIKNINTLRNNTLNNSNQNNNTSRPQLNTTPSINTTSLSRSSITTPISNTSRPSITPVNNTSRSNISYSSPSNNVSLNTSNDIFRLDCSSIRSNSDFIHSNNASLKINDAAFTFPTPFRGMDNIHQICSWLCENPNILLLAYNMYLSMQSPVAEGFNFVSSNFNLSATAAPYIPKQEDKTKMNRDFLEELKCLFLRARNPKKSAYEDLVRQIFNCDLNSAEGIDWLRTANRQFGDFRNKFLDSVKVLINEFKANRVTTENINMNYPLMESEVISFVDESYTLNVLQRWLNATNMTELKAQNTLRTLQRFVQKAFIINYDSRNTEGTKSLDKITKNIAVPSRNGKNIASNLQI